MFRRTLQFGGLLMAMVLATSAGALAQRNGAGIRRVGQRQPPPVRRQPTPQERKMLNMPPQWQQRLQNMTPAQQQKFLNNNQRFLNLPPQQQAQIRARLQMLNNLTPEQRQALMERERVWQQMTPQQQRDVRQNLLPAWNSMRPVRRQVLLGKLRDLRGLDDTQRSAKLNDEGFMSGMSPDEQQMLRQLSELRVGDQGPPGEF
jgi:hypothetical protein